MSFSRTFVAGNIGSKVMQIRRKYGVHDTGVYSFFVTESAAVTQTCWISLVNGENETERD